jgi:hypothetical protein
MEDGENAARAAPYRQPSGGSFWKWMATAVALLLSGAVGIQFVEHSRKWQTEDEVAERARRVEQTSIDAEEQRQSARLDAEVANARRATLVKIENVKHPERFREFTSGSLVRVLGNAPEVAHRGMRCSVMLRHEVEDEMSGVVCLLRYSVTILPLLRPDDTICLEPVCIDAEYLAQVGSDEEAAEFRRRPDLLDLAAKQDEVIKSATVRERHAGTLDLQEGDLVVILQTDPRPAVRGHRGQVIRVVPAEFEDAARIPVTNYEVLLDSPGLAPLGTVRVKVTNLGHAPAAPRLR